MAGIPPHAFLAATPNICRNCSKLENGCKGSIPPIRERPHLFCIDYVDAKKEILTFSADQIAPILRGEKNGTLRQTPHGKAGDTFLVAGITYQITTIIPISFTKACQMFYTAEGCKTPDEMEHVITAIYPDTRPQTYLFMHLFAAVISK